MKTESVVSYFTTLSPIVSLLSPTKGLVISALSLMLPHFPHSIGPQPAATGPSASDRTSGTNQAGHPGTIREILRFVAVILGVLFLLSATLNLGVKIPIGFTELSFSSPSSSIAGFEVVIGLLLLSAAAISNLYVYGGALLLALVGIAEGLLSSEVQGLARNLHETMVPFVAIGWLLLVLDSRNRYRTAGRKTAGQKRWRVVTILQFFVGGLVTLGGAAYARGGAYPVGTAFRARASRGSD